MRRPLLLVAVLLLGSLVSLILYGELRPISVSSQNQSTEPVEASESDLAAAKAEASLYRLPTMIKPSSLSCHETRFDINPGGRKQGLLYRWCVESSTGNVSGTALGSIAIQDITPRDSIASDHCVGVLEGDGTPLSIAQRCTATIPFESCVIGPICSSEVAVVITNLSTDGSTEVVVTVP